MFTKKSPTNIDYTSSVSSATKAGDTYSLIGGQNGHLLLILHRFFAVPLTSCTIEWAARWIL
jgi:hypothetical protein